MPNTRKRAIAMAAPEASPIPSPSYDQLQTDNVKLRAQIRRLLAHIDKVAEALQRAPEL